MNIVDFDKLSEMFWDGNFMEIHKDDIPSIPSAFEGMTNGEVIKALFPDIENRLDERTGIMLVKWADGTTKTFKASWWNAPYNKGEEE